MARKRANGEGSVRKRKDGRWEGRIVAGHKDNGKPIFRYVLAPTQKNCWPSSIRAWSSTGAWSWQTAAV